MKHELKESYGYLFEDELINDIDKVGFLKEFKENSEIIKYGQYTKGIPLIISGTIKVLRRNQNGDELVLYFLEKGESCSMTMNCCFGQKKSEIRAIAETDVKIISIPVEKMKDWLQKYRTWMAFVFESYNNRFEEMINAIDNLSFSNMNKRLIKYLKDKVIIQKSTTLTISHKEIAQDLNTSRVVVSRLLKSIENNGKIELGRKKILVLEF